MSSKRILITGSAGFLGSRFATWVLENHPGTEIVGIDDLSGGFIENVPAGVDFHEGDCGEVLSCREPIFSRRFDAVFHFAAYAAECLSPFVRQYNYRNNVVSTMGLLNQCLAGDVGRFVFTSSIAVYGHGAAPFSEADACLPNDPYGVAKLAVELDLRIAGEQHGLDYCILRPHNIYGPGQSLWDTSRNVIAIWCRQTVEGNPLTIYGDGGQRRAFTYIDDILSSLWQAGFAPEAAGQVINLGGSTPTTIMGAAELFESPVVHLPSRHEVQDAWCSTEKSEALLGYRDQTVLRDGVAAMLEWAMEAWERHASRRAWRGPEIELR
jgi:UDP-glucose 4-epimerase